MFFQIKAMKTILLRLELDILRRSNSYLLHLGKGFIETSGLVQISMIIFMLLPLQNPLY